MTSRYYTTTFSTNLKALNKKKNLFFFGKKIFQSTSDQRNKIFSPGEK